MVIRRRLTRANRWAIGCGVAMALLMVAVPLSCVSALVSDPKTAASIPPPPASATEPPPGQAFPPSPSPTSKPKKGTALYVLNTLETRDAMATGYRRARFGQPWADVDHNNCDQRNDVLRRDLRHRHTKPGTGGCILARGEFLNPYTGNKIDFVRGKTDVDIDHVVALSDAWKKGAGDWPAARRREFANDPLNLLATSGHSNMTKGNDDASEWLPADWKTGVQCRYVARQIAVKAKYDVAISSSERGVMQVILEKCPTIEPPTSKSAAVPAPKPIGEPKIKAKPVPRKQPAKPQPRRVPNVYYENCDAVRAAGVAPIHRGDPGYARYLDRDGDGVGCE